MIKDSAPHEAGKENELSFEQALHIIANIPKAVVDEKMKQAKKSRQKKSKRYRGNL